MIVRKPTGPPSNLCLGETGNRYWYPTLNRWGTAWHNTYRYDIRLKALSRYKRSDTDFNWTYDTFGGQLVQRELFDV